MAGTVTVSRHPIGRLEKYVIDWTSDASGDADTTLEKVRGKLIKGVTDPDGSAVPTASYDITITDEEGVDVLGNCQDDLADRDASNTEEVYFNLKPDGATVVGAYPVVNDDLTVAVANAGNAKSGRLVLYVQRMDE